MTLSRKRKLQEDREPLRPKLSSPFSMKNARCLTGFAQIVCTVGACCVELLLFHHKWQSNWKTGAKCTALSSHSSGESPGFRHTDLSFQWPKSTWPNGGEKEDGEMDSLARGLCCRSLWPLFSLWGKTLSKMCKPSLPLHKMWNTIKLCL